MATKIRADVLKNTLYLILEGVFGDAEIGPAVVAAHDEAKKLRPGFSVITDVTAFKPTSLNAGDAIKGVQADLVRLGMKHVVRVVGSNALGAMQFDRHGKEAGYGGSLKVEMAASVADAERLLR